jgi:hypothetical protein
VPVNVPVSVNVPVTGLRSTCPASFVPLMAVRAIPELGHVRRDSVTGTFTGTWEGAELLRDAEVEGLDQVEERQVV